MSDPLTITAAPVVTAMEALATASPLAFLLLCASGWALWKIYSDGKVERKAHREEMVALMDKTSATINHNTEVLARLTTILEQQSRRP
jgi:hypothetical protein